MTRDTPFQDSTTPPLGWMRQSQSLPPSEVRKSLQETPAESGVEDLSTLQQKLRETEEELETYRGIVAGVRNIVTQYNVGEIVTTKNIMIQLKQILQLPAETKHENGASIEHQTIESCGLFKVVSSDKDDQDVMVEDACQSDLVTRPFSAHGTGESLEKSVEHKDTTESILDIPEQNQTSPGAINHTISSSASLDDLDETYILSDSSTFSQRMGQEHLQATCLQSEKKAKQRKKRRTIQALDDDDSVLSNPTEEGSATKVRKTPLSQKPTRRSLRRRTLAKKDDKQILGFSPLSSLSKSSPESYSTTPVALKKANFVKRGDIDCTPQSQTEKISPSSKSFTSLSTIKPLRVLSEHESLLQDTPSSVLSEKVPFALGKDSTKKKHAQKKLDPKRRSRRKTFAPQALQGFDVYGINLKSHKADSGAKEGDGTTTMSTVTKNMELIESAHADSEVSDVCLRQTQTDESNKVSSIEQPSTDAMDNALTENIIDQEIPWTPLPGDGSLKGNMPADKETDLELRSYGSVSQSDESTPARNESINKGHVQNRRLRRSPRTSLSPCLNVVLEKARTFPEMCSNQAHENTEVRQKLDVIEELPGEAQTAIKCEEAPALSGDPEIQDGPLPLVPQQDMNYMEQKDHVDSNLINNACSHSATASKSKDSKQKRLRRRKSVAPGEDEIRRLTCTAKRARIERKEAELQIGTKITTEMLDLTPLPVGDIPLSQPDTENSDLLRGNSENIVEVIEGEINLELAGTLATDVSECAIHPPTYEQAENVITAGDESTTNMYDENNGLANEEEQAASSFDAQISPCLPMANDITDRLTILFPKQNVENKPCASARLFACFTLMDNCINSTEGSNNNTVETIQDLESIRSLESLLRWFVQAELTSDGTNEDGIEAKRKKKTKIEFCAFDCSSTMPAVDTRIGSNIHVEESIHTLHEIATEMSKVCESSQDSTNMIDNLRSFQSFLRNLEDKSDQATSLRKECAKTMPYHWEETRFIEASRFYRKEFELLELAITEPDKADVVLSNSTFKKRLGEFIGRAIRFYLRKFFNPAPLALTSESDENAVFRTPRVESSSIRSRVHELVEMTIPDGAIGLNTAAADGAVSSVFSTALKRGFEFLILNDQIQGSDSGTYISNFCTSEAVEKGLGTKKSPVVLSDSDLEQILLDIEDAQMSLAGVRGLTFIRELLHWPGVADEIQRAGGWRKIEQYAGMFKRLGLGNACPEEIYFSILADMDGLLYRLNKGAAAMELTAQVSDNSLRQVWRKFRCGTSNKTVLGRNPNIKLIAEALREGQHLVFPSLSKPEEYDD